MVNVGLFYGILANFVVIWYIVWLFGILYGYLVYFPHVGLLYQEKFGNPL
jgi:ABC-type transporter Mla subunit MlaD